MRRAQVALLLASLACSGLAQNEDGWNFTPAAGARTKADAQMLTLAASFEDGTDPRLPVWWASFKAAFYKTYPDALAEQTAYKNWLGNLDLIYGINSDTTIPFWTTGNFYADYDYETFRATFLMTSLNITALSGGRRLLSVDTPIAASELHARRRLAGSSVDWRLTGRLTPVKDQGGCGSCWAYAATASIEASYLIGQGQTAQQTKLDLSEQQIIDCSNAGSCAGGGSDYAIRYVNSKYLTTENIYPSTYADGNCKADGPPQKDQAVQLSAPTIYPGNTEALLMQAVSKAPTIIYFHVVGDFFGYSGGTYYPRTCGTAINHAMVVVGYSYTGNPADSYWIIRNSWGSGWGQSGYIYVQMTGTATGPCGMYQFIFQAPTDFDLTMGGSPAPALSPSPSPKPPSPKSKPPPRRRRSPRPPRGPRRPHTPSPPSPQ